MTKITTWEQLSKVTTGDKLRVVKTDSDVYLPVDFIATVQSVSPRGENSITLYDNHNTDTTHSIYDIDNFEIDRGEWVFEKVIGKGATTTLTKRKAAAKAIRKAEKDLIALMGSLVNDLSLEIDYNIDIDICYNPPKEKY
tara:strand:- start:316 stop:735 length:420 start_codon:yes stop_codon:yes gene_type:complete